MKDGIHPKYYPNSKVTCTCGNTFTVGSTLPEIHVEICSRCHPFFTGEMKFVDTQGRVEKFQAKQAQAKKYSKKKTDKKIAQEKEEQRPQTLKEMLVNVKSQL
jgi:large subunit ribosomal protein L31